MKLAWKGTQVRTENVVNIAPVDSMVAILSDHFKVHSKSGSPSEECSVRLTDIYLSYQWIHVKKDSEVAGQTYDDNNLVVVAVRDIVGCQVMKTQPTKKANSQAPDTESKQNTIAYLCVYAYPCKNRSRLGLTRPQIKRVRKNIIFVVDRSTNWSDNHELAQTWRKAILWLRADKTRVLMTGKFLDCILLVRTLKLFLY